MKRATIDTDNNDYWTVIHGEECPAAMYVYDCLSRAECVASEAAITLDIARTLSELSPSQHRQLQIDHLLRIILGDLNSIVAIQRRGLGLEVAKLEPV